MKKYTETDLERIEKRVTNLEHLLEEVIQGYVILTERLDYATMKPDAKVIAEDNILPFIPKHRE